MMVVMLFMMRIMVFIGVVTAMVVVMLYDMISWVVIMGIPVLSGMMLDSMWVEESIVISVLMGAVSHIVVYFMVCFSMHWCVNWSMNWSVYWSVYWSVFWSMGNWVRNWMVCIRDMSRMKWSCMVWCSVYWCMRCWSVCSDMWGFMMGNWVSSCVDIMTSTKVGINTIGISVMSMVSWVSVMMVSGVIVSVMRLVVSFMSMSVIMTSVPIVMTMCGVQIVTMCFIVMSSMVIIVMVHWLHFQDQITARCVNIGWIENRRVSLKSTRCLVPSSTIEGIKIISPVEEELTSLFIICKDFNIVVKHIPWHIDWVESISPGVESRRPEVHSQGLCFVHKLDRRVVVWDVADFHAINCPADIVWCP